MQLSDLVSLPPKSIDKLEKVKRQASGFISGGYISRDHGCVTQMLSDLHLPLL